MRISTSQIYGSAASGIERNQAQLAKLQNQISSNRRILTPADDPVGAARALAITQVKAVQAQYAENQGAASDRLALVDRQLGSLTDLLQSVRERAVQAGNTVLADSDRQAIASELETRLDELLGIANSRNAEGDYLFSGYQGATKPFVRGTTVSYLGDDGERLLQVTESQQMASNIPGSELFMNIREGNGSFATAAGGNGPGLANQGSGVIEVGSVLDPQRWQSALNDDSLWQGASNRGLQIRFSSPGGVSSYQIFDASTPLPASGATPLGPEQPFATGQAIPQLATNFGLQVVINGMPAAGDTFAIRPSANQSVFQTVQEMVARLRSPLASRTARTEYTAQMQGHLANLDQALTNVSRVQTVVGARMRSLDALSSHSEALGIQYQQALTALDGLDYAKAISDFTLQQVTLEAAQKSFVAISGLSLFKYI